MPDEGRKSGYAMSYPSRRYPGKQKKCWCGSGKKQKNCHGASRVERAPTETKREQPTGVPVLGVPGEEQKIWVVPVPSDDPKPKREDLGGLPGKYKAQFLLSRPGYPVTQEREYKFIDDIVGSSHIAIAKPLRERKADDPDRVYLGANAKGEQLTFIGFANDAGYLGKIVTAEFLAESAQDAEGKAYGALAPFLSAWAVHLDIPVHVETIQITELRTSINSLRVRNPYLEMTFPGGVSPVLSDEFCIYASLYREGLNSNSGFYRFLCFYKVIESILARQYQARLAKETIGTGDSARPRTFAG